MAGAELAQPGIAAAPKTPREIVLRLKRPQPSMLAMLASGYSAIYPCHVSAAKMRSAPIGTGADGTTYNINADLVAGKLAEIRALLQPLEIELGQWTNVGIGHGRAGAQVLAERWVRAEVGREQRQVLDDQAGGVDLVGLDVLGVDAVVADVRIRQRDDLLAVAGVGEDFLVTNDGGVEHHLTDGGAGGPDGIADKDRAVC